ncbi:hypothetical protein GX441_02630 [bacterium]|nr:hypothetical protein [bacterium]
MPSKPSKKKLCDHWGEDACTIEGLVLERLGDFYRVRGKATNAMECTLPHLRLKLTIYNSKGASIVEDVFHITNRKLAPHESSEFKIEGEWIRGMNRAKITLHAYPVEKRYEHI